MYYWLVTTDWTKKNPFGLYGPYNSSYAAQRAMDKLGVESEIVESKYGSMDGARGEVKAILAEKYPEKFKQVAGRMRHK